MFITPIPSRIFFLAVSSVLAILLRADVRQEGGGGWGQGEPQSYTYSFLDKMCNPQNILIAHENQYRAVKLLEQGTKLNTPGLSRLIILSRNPTRFLAETGVRSQGHDKIEPLREMHSWMIN